VKYVEKGNLHDINAVVNPG